MNPVASIGTSASILQVELIPSRSLYRDGVHLIDVSGELETLEWLCSSAAAVASMADSFGGEEPFESRRWRLRPVLIRAHYGSPLVAVLGIPEMIAVHVSAVGLLVCGLKYVWGLDLELRSHREEQRTRFYKAREAALRAEAKLEALHKELDVQLDPLARHRRRGSVLAAREAARREMEELKQKFEALSKELGWGDGTARQMVDKRTVKWEGEEAVWSLEDD
jgi:hypothetical protein